MTILDNFKQFWTIETIFDNWKDCPGDLTFETMITILTIENLTSVNHYYLTINCDTGQHSQFLRCLREVAANHTGPHLLFTSMGDGKNPAWGCYSFVGYQGVPGQVVTLGSPACLVRTELSLVDKIELGRAYQPITGTSQSLK